MELMPLSIKDILNLISVLLRSHFYLRPEKPIAREASIGDWTRGVIFGRTVALLDPGRSDLREVFGTLRHEPPETSTLHSPNGCPAPCAPRPENVATKPFGGMSEHSAAW